MKKITNSSFQQHGSTLIVSLVMLIVLTLLVVSAIRSSNVSLRVVGNMQIQQETIAAAQQATEHIISNNFTLNPTTSSVSVTIGSATYVASIALPTCNQSKSLLNNQVISVEPTCQSRLSSPDGLFGPSAPLATASLCSAQQWEVKATVTDNGAATVLHQGVSLAVDSTTPCNPI